MTIVLFAGLDVSLETTGIWVVDADGRLIMEAMAASDPADICDVLTEIDGTFERVGFEAGPVRPKAWFLGCPGPYAPFSLQRFQWLYKVLLQPYSGGGHRTIVSHCN